MRARAAAPETWADFERLIAAIHKVAHEGAEVRWNEKIGGRQFDVTIRFRHGLYDYLTVIECRRRKGPVKAGHVEAFVTKARDAKADRAIFASASRYQSGAVQVAERHRINLILVRENRDRLEAVLGDPEQVVHIPVVALIYSDGERLELPRDNNALNYYSRNIRIGFSNASRTLHSLLEFHLRRLLPTGKDRYEVADLELPQGTRVLSPRDDDNVRLSEVAAVQVQYGITEGRPIISDARLPEFLLSPDIELEDITTGDRWIFGRFGLPVSIGTEFKEARYYKSLSLGFYYYCHQIHGDTATMWLVESFQHGRLVQVKFTIKTKYSEHYAEVKDARTIRRLTRRLKALRL